MGNGVGRDIIMTAASNGISWEEAARKRRSQSEQQDPVFADPEVNVRYKTQRRTGVYSGLMGSSSLGASAAKTLLGQ